MSDITPINPSAGLPEDGNEDPFESMLDAESDEDFGYVVTRDRASSGDSHPVKLAEWKAQDFASIYTRFRPHLERHARRFLNNQSQVDEVVQDAFLYLMVSLPELDSEIGVLRFLKWKTRLLCLDVIRASGKAYITNIDDVAEPVSTDPEVSAALEQQDDAAVIRLAMSKLNPRHREVLLASMYEEKTTLQIAEQVGLSENATRQLVFRARSAFKKALLGDDVNTDGMSAAAILSVAARKAAAEAKKAGAQAMVFALFLVLAVGSFVAFSRNTDEVQVVAEAPIVKPTSSSAPAVVPGQAPDPLASPLPKAPVGPEESGKDIAISLPAPAPSESSSPFPASALDEIFDNPADETELFRFASVPLDVAVRQEYAVMSDQGALAEFSFASDSEQPFKNLRLTIEIDGQPFFIEPKNEEFYVVTDKSGLDHYIYFGSISYVADENGKIWTRSELSKSTVRVELAISPKKGIIDASFLSISASE